MGFNFGDTEGGMLGGETGFFGGDPQSAETSLVDVDPQGDETDTEIAAAPTAVTVSTHHRPPPTLPPPSPTSTSASTQPSATITADPPPAGSLTSTQSPLPQATSPVPPPTTAVSDPRATSSTGGPPFSVGPAVPVKSATAGASDPSFPSQADPDAASSSAFITALVAPSQATLPNSSTQVATSSASGPGSKLLPVVVWVLVAVLVITALVAGLVAYLCRRRLMRTRAQQQPGNGGRSRRSMSQLLTSAPRPETQAFATEAVVPPETRTSAFREPPSALYIPTTGARWQSDPLGPDTVTETQTPTLSSTGPSELYPYSQSASQSPIIRVPDERDYFCPDVESSAEASNESADHAAAGAVPLMRASFATVDPPPYDWNWQPASDPRLQAAGGPGAVTSRPFSRRFDA